MPIDVELLARICKEPGAPGFETRIRNVVLEELEGLADEVRVDAMGNIIALKKGKSAQMKAMAAAHMDEIGFIVTHIDSEGFLRFNPLGGFDPKTLTSQRVLVHGAVDDRAYDAVDEDVGVLGQRLGRRLAHARVVFQPEREAGPVLLVFVVVREGVLPELVGQNLLAFAEKIAWATPLGTCARV